MAFYFLPSHTNTPPPTERRENVPRWCFQSSSRQKGCGPGVTHTCEYGSGAHREWVAAHHQQQRRWRWQRGGQLSRAERVPAARRRGWRRGASNAWVAVGGALAEKWLDGTIHDEGVPLQGRSTFRRRRWWWWMRRRRRSAGDVIKGAGCVQGFAFGGGTGGGGAGGGGAGWGAAAGVEICQNDLEASC
jgi:hypothetical protein